MLVSCPPKIELISLGNQSACSIELVALHGQFPRSNHYTLPLPHSLFLIIMKLLFPALLLLAAETGVTTAFVPTQPPSSSFSATYAPFFFASEQDTIEDTFASAADAVTPAKDSASAASPTSDKDKEKEIDWDALLSAASAFGGAIAKGVEAAAPVVAGAAVDAAFDIGGAASSAVADLQKLNKQQGTGKSFNAPQIPKISFSGWKSSVDVSIPYDAACRLAYEDWKVKYGKTTPPENDPLSAEERYQQFRISYDRVTIANIVAKKKVRDAGGFEEARTLNCVELDEYADRTDLEYTEATRTPTWGEIWGDLADVATSVVSKSVVAKSASDAGKAKLRTPVPPKTKPVMKPKSSPKPSMTARPSFSMFITGNSNNGVAKKQTSAKPKMAMAKMQPKPFFGTAISSKSATPAKTKAMTAKEAEFAKKIEASRAAKAKALAERKKKEQQRLQKARANFRG